MISRQQLTACVLAVAAKTLEQTPNLQALDGKPCDDPAVGAVGVDYSNPPAKTLIRIEPTRFVVVLRDSRGKIARYAQKWTPDP